MKNILIWIMWFHISRTTGIDRKPNVRGYYAYICREKECLYAISNGKTLEAGDRDEFMRNQKNIWEKILEKENRTARVYEGKKKGRDSRLDNRVIIPLPNDCDAEKVCREVSNYFDGFKVHYLAVVHSGTHGKKGITNRHIHVQFSERDPHGGPKNREVSRKNFYPDLMQRVSLSLEQQGYEIATNPRNLQRPRLNRAAYQKALRGERDLEKSTYLTMREIKIVDQAKNRLKKAGRIAAQVATGDIPGAVKDAAISAIRSKIPALKIASEEEKVVEKWLCDLLNPFRGPRPGK